jgi:hypothetical protein
MRVGLIKPYETDDPADSAESNLALAEISLRRAEEVLKIELECADVIDLKSVGLATADVAALTILIAAHKSVLYWWAPATLMAMSGVCFFIVLRSRQWEWAGEFEPFRRLNYLRTRLEITEAMLADVIASREQNYPHLVAKAKYFRRGYWLLATGLLTLFVIGAWTVFG